MFRLAVVHTSHIGRDPMVTQIDLLRQMPIFGGLKNETLQSLLELSSEVDIPQGDYFFREGEQGKSVFVLESGEGLVQRLWEGEPIVLRQLGKGDCFGEMALIDFEPRSASVMAKTDCHAIEVPNRSLIQLCKQDVEQYAMVMMNLGREVSRRLRVTGDRLFHLEQSLCEPID